MAYTERYVDNTATGANDGTSWTDAWTWAEFISVWNQTLFDGIADSVRVNFRGTYSLTATYTFAVSAKGGYQVVYQGCDTTVDDGGFFDVATSSNARLIGTGENAIIRNFDLEGSSTSNLIQWAGDGGWVDQCRSVNSGQGSAISVDECSVTRCYAETASTNTAYNYSAITVVRGAAIGNFCVATGGASCIGSNASYRANMIVHNVCDGAGSSSYGVHINGLNNANGFLFAFNTIYDSNGPGLYLNPSADLGDAAVSIILGNVIYGCATYGIEDNGGAEETNMLVQNAMGNNTSGRTNFASTFNEIDEITLTASPFVSTTDLTLNETAGGGALCRAAFGPQYTEDATDSLISTLDVGGFQHADPAGGGGTGVNNWF